MRISAQYQVHTLKELKMLGFPPSYKKNQTIWVYFINKNIEADG